MAPKGFQYKYKLKSKYPQEYEEVSFTYQQVGWIEIGAIPDNGIPTHIIFEWPYDRPPIYPDVSWT